MAKTILAESGSWKCRDNPGFDPDRWAQKIRNYGAGERDPDSLTVGVLVQSLFGSDLNVRRVDGMAPGKYLIVFDKIFPDCEGPVAVEIGLYQRAQDLTLACARACARFGGYVFSEVWGEPELEAIALALAVPRSVLAQSTAPHEIARLCCVDLDVALQRLRLLGSIRESGQRPAIAG